MLKIMVEIMINDIQTNNQNYLCIDVIQTMYPEAMS